MSQSTRRGRPPHPDVLTPGEWRIVHAVRHGMTNRQIAVRRGISLDAVKFHVANAVAKLSLTNRAELRRWQGAPAGTALRTRSSVSDPRTGRQAAQRSDSMTQDLSLGTVGQISREVSDIGRAVQWFRDVLGLSHLYTFGDLAFFDLGGTRLFLTSRSGEGSAGQSVIYFRVPDIEAAYRALLGRGIAFEGAPHMIFKHDSGVEEWMAFFRDFDGNLLALMSQVAPGP